MSSEILLTQFSHGAGCGCKISPKILDQILSGTGQSFHDTKLLVGNSNKDDAGAYQINDKQVILSTLDFFMPIVDDPFDFGRIASTNALSDIYAMGGEPFMALAILGWPVGKIPEELATEVLEGAKSACKEAKVVLAGGHSIDNPEPIFGLSVNGLVNKGNLKTNSNAKEGNLLFLTKPLGVGILSTAKKKGLVKEQDYQKSLTSMLQLNTIGAVVSSYKEVTAMTDVTGFGLLGHLGEMLSGSGLSAEIDFNQIPILTDLNNYINQGAVPGGSKRNWDSYYEGIIGLNSEYAKAILTDPQTSGGLLISIEPTFEKDFMNLCEKHSQPTYFIGHTTKATDYRLKVVNV